MQPAIIKSSKINFMIQRKITYPVPQQLKIMTQLEENIPKAYRPSDNFKLASITIYTEKLSYEGQLTGKSIAKQLSWNPQSFNTLLQCLMGKRDKMQMKFFPAQSQNDNQEKFLASKKEQLKNNNNNIVHNFEIVCEISSGINLTLFTVEMIPSIVSDPFAHMMKKFSQIQHTFREKQKAYKSKEQSLKSQLNQIEAVQKQIIDSSSIEINLMKKQFIKHVNNEKAKIRKLMGSVPMINPINGLIENRVVATKQPMKKILEKQSASQQEENSKDQFKQKREIKRVDREFYNKPQYKKMEIESQGNSKHSSQQSSNYLEVDKQIKWLSYQERKKNQFQSNHQQSSSDDEIDHQGKSNNSEGVKKQKTFLEQERQRMSNRQSGDNKQWDALFN